jgi:hypothetical protein
LLKNFDKYSETFCGLATILKTSGGESDFPKSDIFESGNSKSPDYSSRDCMTVIKRQTLLKGYGGFKPLFSIKTVVNLSISISLPVFWRVLSFLFRLTFEVFKGD